MTKINTPGYETPGIPVNDPKSVVAGPPPTIPALLPATVVTSKPVMIGPPPTIQQPSPAFDLGFQLDNVNNLENQLGTQAINTETLHAALNNNLDQHLNQMQTNTSIMQSVLTDQLHTQLEQAQANTTLLQQQLESALASQMAKPLEQTILTAPGLPAVQTLAVPVGPPPIIHPVLGSAPGVNFFPGVLPTCEYLRSLTLDQVRSILGPAGTKWQTTDAPGRVITVAYPTNVGIGSPNGVWVSLTSDPNDFIHGTPLAFACQLPYPTQPKPLPITITPTTPPPYTPPPTTVPTPTNCPPIIKFPDCIKICPAETPPPITCKYCLYCTIDKVLYIIKDTDPPRNTSDIKLQCGDPKEWDMSKLVKQCQKTTTTPEQPPSYPQPIPGNSPVDGCDNLFRWQQQLTPYPPNFWAELFKGTADDVGAALFSGSGLVDTAAKYLLDILAIIPGALLDGVQKYATTVPILNCSGTAQEATAILGRVVTGFVGKWLSGAAEGADTSLMYAQNSLCPFRIPTNEAATAAYLSNSLSLDRLQCIVAANGNRWDSWVSVVDSNRTRWNAAETMMLWRRNFISKDFANDYLRQLGYLSDMEKDGLRELTEQVPPVSDLMSMMMRDVEDTQTINWAESDRIFAQKWKGELQKWGNMQGVPELMAKYLFRAHWVLPSPTQAFEFWRRLRKSGKYGTEVEFRTKIRNLLLQADYHPDWVDAYMDVAFAPLTRVDAGRAFEVGAIDKDKLLEAYTNLGYDDDNAKTLVDFKQKQIAQKWMKSSYVRQYAEGDISESLLRDLLRNTGLPYSIVDQCLVYAKTLLQINRRKVCVKSYKKRFLLGEYDLSSAAAKLSSDGLDAVQVDEITKAWQCEKMQRGKSIPMSTLCGWYERGVIDEVELYTRAKNLGYSEDDAAKLTRDCMTRVGMKLDKEKVKAMAMAARQARQVARAQAQAEKQFEKGIKDLDTQSRKAQKIAQDRTKLLIKAAEVYAKKTNTLLPDAVVGLRQIINKAIASGLAPINVIYQGAASLAEDPNVADLQTFAAELAALLVDVS